MIDYEGEVIKRLWAILDADTDFDSLVQPTNRIRLYAVTGEEDEGQSPIKTTWNDGDFPEVAILTTGTNDTMWSLAASYGMRGGVTAAAHQMPVELHIDCVLEVVHMNLNAYQMRRLNNVIATAIRAAGPNLGIVAFPVFPIGPLSQRHLIASRRAGDVADAGGTKRFITVHTLGVLVKASSTDLLPE